MSAGFEVLAQIHHLTSTYFTDMRDVIRYKNRPLYQQWGGRKRWDKVRKWRKNKMFVLNCFRLQLKCDVTRWRTGGEVKGKLANGVGCQYPSLYLGTWCIQHYYRWCAHLGCASSRLNWRPPADLRGLVRFAERRNLVSARVPSHFNWLLPFRENKVVSTGSSGRGLRLACWDCGFESHRGHGCLSVVSVVFCQVQVSATSWSLVQRSPGDCDASLCVI